MPLTWRVPHSSQGPEDAVQYPDDVVSNFSYTHAPARWDGVLHKGARLTCGGGFKAVTKQVQELDHVIIRFAGDSGDGMQLTGDRFTQETAVFGNDLSTLPNFPAEIRAPAGTLPGVSSFQLHFADHDILT